MRDGRGVRVRTVYRLDKQTGEVAPIERWKAEARLVGNYSDEKAALAAATRNAPIETVGALYWTEEEGS